ncbi:MAG: ABC transporter ATP-binding protein [Candidatus Latescibacteria bacterium]|nr:ABC transporter ATP-binding protein [Candidatus Latescibacterota bacterium]
MSNSFLVIDNFSFALGKEKILNSVSFGVDEGEYVSLIGPNGAGKTTLLKCLIRIYTGGEGSITLVNKPLDQYTQKELARIISYVPQSNGRFLPFTVHEFVMMGRYPHLSPFTSLSKGDRQAVKDALALTGTGHLSERQLSTLSGGERQTVYIAAAIAQGARILLLDEPTTFLDPKHESDILSILKRVNRQYGITILSVTHDINNAVLHSDRIAVLKHGMLLYVGNSNKIMNNEILESAFDKRFSFIKHPVNGTLMIIPEVDTT